MPLRSSLRLWRGVSNFNGNFLYRPATTTTVVQTVPQPVQTPITALQGLNLNTNGLRNFLDRTLSISHAEKTFDMIKSDMFDALWTGIIVIAVKMAPLILMCIRVRNILGISEDLVLKMVFLY